MEDKMIVKTSFMRTVVSIFVEKLIKKSIGIKCVIDIHEIEICNDDDGATIHLSMNGHLTKNELKTLLNRIKS